MQDRDIPIWMRWCVAIAAVFGTIVRRTKLRRQDMNDLRIELPVRYRLDVNQHFPEPVHEFLSQSFACCFTQLAFSPTRIGSGTILSLGLVGPYIGCLIFSVIQRFQLPVSLNINTKRYGRVH